MFPNSVTGKYTGTGAIKNIVLGFKPDFVLLFNQTDGDVAAMAIRNVTPADAAIDIAAAVAGNAADGITLDYAGADGEGFSVGTDYSENTKVYGYLALRAAPGSSAVAAA